MSIAVLIVNYRAYDDLDRCLASLAAQLRTSDEVIVVDNDGVPESLAGVVARHSRVTTIASPTNIGFAAGVNLAASHATAQFLVLLNPDTVADINLLGAMEEWMVLYPRTAVLGPRIRNNDGSTQPSARRFPGLSTVFGGRSTWLTKRFPKNWWSRRNLLGLDSDYPLDVDWVAGSCLMTRRETFETLGGLDDAFFLYWEDADYCRRAINAGGRCTYLPSVGMRHGGGGSTKYALHLAVRAFHRSAYRLFWKHAGAAGRILAPFVYAGLMIRGEMRLNVALRKAERAGRLKPAPYPRHRHEVPRAEDNATRIAHPVPRAEHRRLRTDQGAIS